MSTTRIISIREFRAHISKYLKEAQKKNVHFVVMRHSEAIAHVSPVKRNDSLEELRKDVAIARQEYKEGKTFTTEQARKILGI